VSANDARPAGGRGVRLDKWLWAARFYKTRALACEAIENGHVRVDAEQVKPARMLKVGDRVGVRKGVLVWNVAVVALDDKRGSATVAAGLFAEDEASIAARTEAIALRRAAAPPRFPGRPTKRDRRALDDFLDEP
jgi:ribosome-associated heat shock protein Hsp15